VAKETNAGKGKDNTLVKVGIGVAALGILASGRGRRSKRGPKGQGVFVIGYTNSMIGGKPSEAAKKLKDAGMDWVMLPTIMDWGSGGGNVAKHLPDYAKACRDVGVTPWAWGWPEPTKAGRYSPQQWLDVTIEAARKGRCAGICVNAENPSGTRGWDQKTERDRQDAAMIARSIKKAGYPFMLSSYPIPEWHEHFPWNAFLSQGSVIGSPQLYSVEKYRNIGKMSYDAYKARGFKTVVPTFGAQTSSIALMRAEYMTVKSQIKFKAWSWWRWDFIFDRKKHRELTKELQRLR